ncbi:MAG: hypothetical protein HQL34_14095, partial [Alphaproteobacteria bacterium]|nr:hypothetical protein [Alphaproteobacteria bacterium]
MTMAGRKLPSPAPEREDRFDARHLSARQAEILALLMAGKANKDIARALGLGLGTIKQHLAALYKKLGVTNRATAVSRGFAMGGETRSPSSRLPSSRLLADASVMELRPTTVLSMAMDGKGDDFEGREKDWLALRGACAVATAAMDSAMVGRPGESVDIILGLHRADQDNVLRALQIARAVVAGLGPGRPLRAGLASGYLMASVHPRGGWTGEVVAGRVITAARSLRAVAEPFQVRIDAASHRLLLFARRSESGTVAETDAPLTLDLLREWPGASLASAPPRLVGREAERRLLEGYLGRLAAEERGAFLLVEGEAGMGKTTLCLAVGAEAVRLGIDWRHFRCGAPGRDLASFLAETCGTVMPEMAELAHRNPIALLIDDLHL